MIRRFQAAGPTVRTYRQGKSDQSILHVIAAGMPGQRRKRRSRTDARDTRNSISNRPIVAGRIGENRLRSRFVKPTNFDSISCHPPLPENSHCKIRQNVSLPRSAQEIVKNKIVPVGPRADFIRSPAVCVEGNPGAQPSQIRVEYSSLDSPVASPCGTSFNLKSEI